jgi:hypothetical protein
MQPPQAQHKCRAPNGGAGTPRTPSWRWTGKAPDVRFDLGLGGLLQEPAPLRRRELNTLILLLVTIGSELNTVILLAHLHLVTILRKKIIKKTWYNYYVQKVYIKNNYVQNFVSLVYMLLVAL